jgi:hypothetical protein
MPFDAESSEGSASIMVVVLESVGVARGSFGEDVGVLDSPVGGSAGWRGSVATFRFEAHRGSTERRCARTARAGALSVAVHCQDALRTRFAGNWCQMLITGERVKPLV